MSQLVPAHELHVGDYIKSPEGVVPIRQIPIKRSDPFTAFYTVPPSGGTLHPVSFSLDEEVEVFARWPEQPR